MNRMDEDSAHIVRLTIQKRGWMDIPSTGVSMYPFLTEGNIGRFELFSAELVRKGDVLLFVNESGRLIGHRVIEFKYDQENQTWLFLLKGDTNVISDGWIPKHRIIGRLIHVNKKWITFKTDGRISYLWGYLVTQCTSLSLLLRLILRIRRRFNPLGK